MGFQRESRSLLLVVVQDAKVLVEAGAETPVLGSKGQRCALWSGLSGARRPLTRWGSRGRAKSPPVVMQRWNVAVATPNQRAGRGEALT